MQNARATTFVQVPKNSLENYSKKKKQTFKMMKAPTYLMEIKKESYEVI